MPQANQHSQKSELDWDSLNPEPQITAEYGTVERDHQVLRHQSWELNRRLNQPLNPEVEALLRPTKEEVEAFNAALAS